MQNSHGQSLPSIDTLRNSYSLFAYLRTLITRCHECLGCARILASPEGARDHMKDKGHCHVNVDGEGRVEMWEVTD